MTGLPASRLGFKNRGLIKEGYVADITIFDFNEVKDNATYDSWDLPPDGIHHVLVNGQLTVKDGKHLKVKNGKILKPDNENKKEVL